MIEKYTYRIVWSDEDSEYVGLCAEFPSLSFLNKSQDKAFKGIRQLVKDVVNDLTANKEAVPEPLSLKNYSGKFMVRVPPDLHRELAMEAQEMHVSLNRYVSNTLAKRNTLANSDKSQH
jgi:predicted HicB family RNase H-like nuclease